MLRTYILLDGKPVPCPNTLAWGAWFETSLEERIVKQETINEVRISTIFLGLDHNFSGKGPPILWETMIFGGEHHSAQWRASSREDALLNHQFAVELVQEKWGRKFRNE